MLEVLQQLWIVNFVIMPLFSIFSDVAGRISGRVHSLGTLGALLPFDNACSYLSVSPGRWEIQEDGSRTDRTGDTPAKRRKVVIDDAADLPSSTWIQESPPLTSVAPAKKSNQALAWVTEDELLPRFERISLFINALKSIRAKYGYRQRRDAGGSTTPHFDDPTALSKSLDAAIGLLSTLYSAKFLSSVRGRFPRPITELDYRLSSRERSNISSTRSFIASLKGQFADDQADLITTVVHDLQAVEENRPIPTYVSSNPVILRRALGSILPTLSKLTTKGSVPSPSNVESNAEIKTEESGEAHDTELTNDDLTGADTPSSSRFMNAFGSLRTPATELVRQFLRKGTAKASVDLKSRRPITIPRSVPHSILKQTRRAAFGPKRLQSSREMRVVKFEETTSERPAKPAKPRLAQARAQLDGADSDCEDGAGDTKNETPKNEGTSPTSPPKFRRSDEQRRRDSLSRHSVFNLKFSDLTISRDLTSPEPSPSPPLRSLPISAEKDDDLGELGATLQLKLDQVAAKRRAEEEERARKAEEKAKREAEEKLRRSGDLRPPKQRLVTPLGESWVQRVKETHYEPGHVDLATTADRVGLKKRDFDQVVPATVWLNDEIVNGSLNWVDKYVNTSAGIKDVKKQDRKCLALGSFFWKTMLVKNGGIGTERSLGRMGVTPKNFLSIDTVLIPVCENDHWTLVVVRPSKRTVSHMDSLDPRGGAHKIAIVVTWLKALLKGDYNAEEWRMVRFEAPLQTNYYDCGVHTITNGICVALGVSPIEAYSSSDMPLQRQRIAAMLLNGGFHDDFDLSYL
jgi:hypothetical protein